MMITKLRNLIKNFNNYLEEKKTYNLLTDSQKMDLEIMKQRSQRARLRFDNAIINRKWRKANKEVYFSQLKRHK